jgi:hypothetical protein
MLCCWHHLLVALPIIDFESLAVSGRVANALIILHQSAIITYTRTARPLAARRWRRIVGDSSSRRIEST